MIRNKRFITVVLALMFSMAFLFIGCNSKEDKKIQEQTNIEESAKTTEEETIKEESVSEENKESDSKPKEKVVIEKASNSNIKKTNSEYSKELSKLFPEKKNTKLYYDGILDYSSVETLNREEPAKGALNINVKGEIADLSGGEAGNKGDYKYSFKYVIENQYVRENYEHHSKTLDRPVSYSRAILKSPVKVGATWSAAYIYKGKKYNGKTKIESVSSKKNICKVITVTTIEGVEGFKNKQYKEVRTYETGKGLVNERFNTTTEGIEFSRRQIEPK